MKYFNDASRFLFVLLYAVKMYVAMLTPSNEMGLATLGLGVSFALYTYLVGIAIINSAISIFYYFRIIIYSYRKEGDNDFNMAPGIKYSVIIISA